MTEAEWLASADPRRLLDYKWFGWPLSNPTAARLASNRKLRLFACACAIQSYGVEHALAIGSGKGGYGVWYETGEADPNDPEDTEQSPMRLAQSWCRPESNQRGVPDGITQAQKAALMRDLVGNPWRPVILPCCCLSCGCPDFELETEYAACAKCGNSMGCPWLAWNDSTVSHLAVTIYADNAFDVGSLSILADALEEAGCPETVECPGCYGRGYQPKYPIDGLGVAVCSTCLGTGRVPHPILGHCRGPGPHVRGCWVVDALLGKR